MQRLLILLLLVLLLVPLAMTLMDDEELQNLLPDAASGVRSGQKMRFCGRRLKYFVFATCGECEPGSDVSLSQMCCVERCNMRDIIAACCPNNF